mmetsp:Transcript_8788/g.35918  ORF Transcript_8788/g.35918 Transcript_8788/m.35918 type:complete len:206 (-) Transcript_8788:957-1574(-)
MASTAFAALWAVCMPMDLPAPPGATWWPCCCLWPCCGGGTPAAAASAAVPVFGGLARRSCVMSCSAARTRPTSPDTCSTSSSSNACACGSGCCSRESTRIWAPLSWRMRSITEPPLPSRQPICDAGTIRRVQVLSSSLETSSPDVALALAVPSSAPACGCKAPGATMTAAAGGTKFAAAAVAGAVPGTPAAAGTETPPSPSTMRV